MRCLVLLILLASALAHTHEFFWTVSHALLSPDGEQERKVVVINNEWPAPQVRVHKDDRVIIHLTNNLTDEDTTLHFHGIFQRGSSFMDGAAMVSQCPISPGATFTYDFTVENQSGTYWYHSHNVAQYGDGLRGVFIVEDDDTDLQYDEDIAIILSDWYHKDSQSLVDVMTKPGASGSEPRIDSSLFNESATQDIHVSTGKVYLLRVVNGGMSATQYLYIEDHTFTIVEIDGVKVEPVEVDSLSLATGQRYTVLLTTKDTNDKNYPLVQMTNLMMRKRYSIQWLVYDDSLPMDSSKVEHKSSKSLSPANDFDLVPLSHTPVLDTPQHRIILDFSADYFGDSKTFHYTLNGQPHLTPVVPTINTIFSANETTVLDATIYGSGTNAFILKFGEIVEIIINSHDHMLHPFHLHGHNFQVVATGAKVHYDVDKEYEYHEYPMIRDTVNVPGRGFVALRFKADNPGAWFFHCHTEWHAVQGLGVVFVEAPDEVLKNQVLPMGAKEICAAGGLKAMGNAAGNDDMDDMEGEVVVPGIWSPKKNDQATPVLESAMPTALQTSSSELPSTISTSITSAEPSSTSEPTEDPQPMKPETSMKEKAIVLTIYSLIMTSVTAIFAVFIQRSMRRKRRIDVDI